MVLHPAARHGGMWRGRTLSQNRVTRKHGAGEDAQDDDEDFPHGDLL
jgi:hypothetical protein